jgi:multiple sugar transport system ATP-binding protein
MASVEAIGIFKTNGTQNVLKGIDLLCAEGDFLVLVGPSGCGKTTLLNLIAGLDRPTRGMIKIGGRDVTDVAPKDRDIAMVFQSYALYPTMTVRGNMGFGLEMRGVPKAERERMILRAAQTLQIEALLDRRPSQLSGGQRQRVAMGRALVRSPAVFLFDEPLSNLDAQLRVEMRLEMKRLHDRLKTTTIYVTHDQIEAMTLATVIGVLKDGVLQQLADPQTIYDSPKNMFVAGFIGSPAINFLRARLEAGDGDAAAVRIARDASAPIVLNLERKLAEVEPYVGKDVIVGIRPEDITEETHRAPGGAAVFEALVDVVEPTGPDVLVRFLLGGASVTARVGPAARPHAKLPMRFAIRAGKAHLFDAVTQERI